VSAFGDRRLVARAGVALVIANVRYWPTVAPIVRRQLSRWEQHASRIPDPILQALALQKLREERFNAEVAATLATLAPRAHRADAVEAIVAFEVMYDYLDGLTEQPTPDPLRDGGQLFRAFTDAVRPPGEASGGYYSQHPQSDDGGYLEGLADAVAGALARLPASASISQVAQGSAARCAGAQTRINAAPSVGSAQLERWAATGASETGLGWREFLAGAASSVLAVHALIAAGADPRTTREQAVEIDRAYLSICTLSTILDSLIDYEDDIAAGEPSFIQLYPNEKLLASGLASAAHLAAGRARTLPNGPHHLMTLVGVVAYYTSAPSASSGFARPIAIGIQQELRPLITPTLGVMRAWRAAKRMRPWPALRPSWRRAR
jgi:tetraprenyl-beta-curcumene synthase